MRDVQADNGNCNHPIWHMLVGNREYIWCRLENLHSLKDNKGDLVVDQVSLPTLTQFSNSVDATSEDSDDGDGKWNGESHKSITADWKLWSGTHFLLLKSSGLHSTDNESKGKEDEDDEGDDLESQTSNHSVCSGCLVCALIGGN